MLSGLNGSLSSLQAHQQKMTVAAGNIANADTRGFKALRATLAEGASGEVRVHLHQDRSPSPTDPMAGGGPGLEKTLSNVDMADELSGMIPTEIGYAANLKTFRTHDDMVGTLLDTLG